MDLGSSVFDVQVRVLSSAPNKHYNFDTIGIETVVLILLPKTLYYRGFRLFLFFSKFHCAVCSIVAACIRGRFFAPKEVTLKLLP